ncbi:HlyD family secretion protein [Klebsiella quasipneumoniae]|uniref:HlyD family secretion protein n=1 Tax=Klebsiella quasipneumoniae TaxID=1463165 RepID=UPI002A4E1F14|nr:HlyD family efflux transporter periplasmic adaptor subunit [Klebsiella quasipneumoniae]
MQKPVNIIVVLIAMLMITGCDNKPENILSGYSHGEFVYLSYSSTAKIEQLLIKKGDNVTPGQELVKMESFDAQNIFLRAEEKLSAESALLRNLESGERPEELDVIRAQIKKARSAESQVKRQLERYRNLYASHAISLAEWEDIRDELTQKRAQVEELINQLKARQLPARQDEISQQLSQVAAAKLERDKALWDVQQTTIVSPVNAKVFDIIYRVGERPSAGKPIISLLPPENIKVRFFIPEAMLGKFKVGAKVRLICDGCTEPFSGVINYISPEAEFTPPVIYSTKRREKLIFMAEAVPAPQQAEQMKVGQPFDVEIFVDE